MPLPLIYHDDYSPEFPADHRFPMDKFRLLRDQPTLPVRMPVEPGGSKINKAYKHVENLQKTFGANGLLQNDRLILGLIEEAFIAGRIQSEEQIVLLEAMQRPVLMGARPPNEIKTDISGAPVSCGNRSSRKPLHRSNRVATGKRS
ncbi:hypothetical protein D3C77_234510 [compost metagenome]